MPQPVSDGTIFAIGVDLHRLGGAKVANVVAFELGEPERARIWPGKGSLSHRERGRAGGSGTKRGVTPPWEYLFPGRGFRITPSAPPPPDPRPPAAPPQWMIRAPQWR
eukprot:gene25431-biopygen16498